MVICSLTEIENTKRWNTLTEVIKDAVVGKGVLNDNCSNEHIVNEMDVPVSTMGLHDV